MDFANLPPNVTANLLKDYNYEQILKVCSSSKQAKANICDNDNFWQYLYNFKFPKETVDLTGTTWKQLYFIKEFANKTFLSRVRWTIGDNNVTLVFQDDFGKYIIIEDPEQIQTYLENYIIPWTTDENGDIWIIVDQDEQGEYIYLKFKPAEIPTALAFMDLLVRYFQEDSGLSIDEYVHQIKIVYFKEPEVRRQIKEEIEKDKAIARSPFFIMRKFAPKMDTPEVQRQKIAKAKQEDEELLARQLTKVREKGYISKGLDRSTFSNHIYFKGIGLTLNKLGVYYILLDS